jgi:hypothetical protein
MRTCGASSRTTGLPWRPAACIPPDRTRQGEWPGDRRRLLRTYERPGRRPRRSPDEAREVRPFVGALAPGSCGERFSLGSRRGSPRLGGNQPARMSRQARKPFCRSSASTPVGPSSYPSRLTASEQGASDRESAATIISNQSTSANLARRLDKARHVKRLRWHQVRIPARTESPRRAESAVGGAAYLRR